MKHRIVHAVMLALTLTTTPAGAQVIRLSTENDIISRNGPNDDLYTFGISIEVDGFGSAWSLRENAFTDRAAGTRFDETYLSVRRALPYDGTWDLDAEVGVVHVGKGLFGEKVQNAVHRVVGSDVVELDYLDSSVYARAAFSATRMIDSGGRFTWGPHLEADLVPGFRSWALVAVDAVWKPSARFAVEMQGGGRFTDVSYAALEPHLTSTAPAGKASLVFDEKIYVTWSYNDFGDEREHVSVGYRLPLGNPVSR